MTGEFELKEVTVKDLEMLYIPRAYNITIYE